MAESDNTKKPLEINSRVILVDRFLEGEEADYIEYLVDEGLRERAINELKIRDKSLGKMDAEVLKRDSANFLTVNVPDQALSKEQQNEILESITSRWSTTVANNYKLSRFMTEKAIDKKIVELI